MLKPSGALPIWMISAPSSHKRRRRHLVGGAVGGIDDDAQALEPQLLREGALGEFDIARLGVLDALGAAELVGCGELDAAGAVDQRFDRQLLLVRELVAVRTEELDAVVVIRIVGGGDHDAEIGAERARQHGDGGRRQRAEQEHVHAGGEKPGGQRLLDHVARKPCVLADHRAVAVAAARIEAAGGEAELEHRIGRHRARLAMPRTPSVPKYLRAMNCP